MQMVKKLLNCRKGSSLKHGHKIILFLRERYPYCNDRKFILLIIQNNGQFSDINYLIFWAFYCSNILIFLIQSFVRICGIKIWIMQGFCWRIICRAIFHRENICSLCYLDYKSRVIIRYKVDTGQRVKQVPCLRSIRILVIYAPRQK